MEVMKHIRRCIGLLTAVAVILAVFPVPVPAAEQGSGSRAQYIAAEALGVKRQLRGTWICTVANMDWPSREARQTENDSDRIRKSKEELTALLDRAVEMNLNAVFFQVSPEGDAFYDSDIVPWSRYLTGTFGRDPGFDPLAFAVEEAHKRNLELHAWFNPYRVSMDRKAATKESLDIEKSVYREHPEWIRSSMDRFCVDPGIPEAGGWVMERVLEVVDKYDVDGVHFDDYFYYEDKEGELKDEETFRTYNEGRFSNLGDWRRNNTYLLVKELSRKLRSVKPGVKFGISPSGVWENKSGRHPDGSNTNTSYTNYGKCFADTKKWVEEELLDYIAPQVYFSFANTRAPYGEIAAWWSALCEGRKVHLYIGQALYKINDDTDLNFKGDRAVPEFSRQLTFNGATPGIAGSILFRMKNLDDPGKQPVVRAIKEELWSEKALIPVMPWKGGSAPAAPVRGRAETVSGGLRLSWADTGLDTAYYAIYRVDMSGKQGAAPEVNTARLIGTVRKKDGGTQEFTDPGATQPDHALYAVTALDRLHNESSGLVIGASLSNYFSDVGKEYSWAAASIDRLWEKGIVPRREDGWFYPGQNASRGDFLFMVVGALQLKASFRDNFTDVRKDAYYYDAIGVAKAVGIAKGDGYAFDPGGSITREDMLVLLARAMEASGIKLEKAGEEYLLGYDDAKLVSSYARDALARLSKAGLLQGTGGGLNPKGTATRAEVTVILQRVIDSIGAR